MAMRCGWQSKMPKIFLLFVLLFILNGAIQANEYQAQVKHAILSLSENDVFLNADLAFHLSPQANEALQNGVPLFWNVKMKVQRMRNFWFDKTLLRKELHYRLQYHALLKMYRVKNENTGVVNSFSTLAAALNEMATVRDIWRNTFDNFSPDDNYVLAIKVFFEDEKLPLPLQTQVLANKQWQLSSDWTNWDLPNFVEQN
jgi:hypothetical protein